ncbi:MAG: GTPase HflX [Chloroflexota bacterium]|nr:GTPase HflX [Chloroflexota bacterium]
MSKPELIANEHAERAYLVGIEVQQESAPFSVADSLSELALLAETAGLEVVGQTFQRLRKINAKTFIGSGKLEQIIDEISLLDVNVIVFDEELSPRHQRELEKQFGETIRLLDRSALILDIFARHARTSEGALQVELAQYEYRLPRLTRQWTHLARQAGGGGARGGSGGVGLRGPGETQLEVDRREITRKITKLKAALEQVRSHRSLHRSRRRGSGLPLAALVGYTNAGKSSLLNALAGSDVYAADQLFATLDPTTRRISLPNHSDVLLTDTVGFIQKLPTTLIAAFRATLEEVAEADLLLHIVDVSHPNALQHIDAVEDTLAEIDAAGMPRLLVLNKIDLLDGPLPQLPLVDNYRSVVATSALDGSGIADLLATMRDVLAERDTTLEVLLPYHAGSEYSKLYERGYIRRQSTEENGWLLTLSMPKQVSNYYLKFAIDSTEST